MRPAGVRAAGAPPAAVRNSMTSCPLLPSSSTGLTSQVLASSTSPRTAQLAPRSVDASTHAAVVMLCGGAMGQERGGEGGRAP